LAKVTWISCDVLGSLQEELEEGLNLVRANFVNVLSEDALAG
jgi:hypothetical protein